MCQQSFHGIMRWSIEVVWRGADDDAGALLEAISPDDATTFAAEIVEDGNESVLQIEVESDSLSSMRATINDILACLSAAESAIKEA